MTIKSGKHINLTYLNLPMTREEFETEFRVLKDAAVEQKEIDWHHYIDRNMHKLSDNALRYIIANAGDPFGKWMVDRAIYLTAFEDVVLKGDS